MPERSGTGGTKQGETRLELTHQRREARTALELAVVALAPWKIIEGLATAAGLLEALSELPPDSPPAIALMPKVLELSKGSLERWGNWEKDVLGKKLPRG